MSSKQFLRAIPRASGIALLWGWVGFSLLAFGWVVLSSFKSNPEFFGSVWSLPAEIRWDNYVRAFVSSDFGLYLWNTMLVVGASTLLVLALATPAAYTLTRIPFRGSRWLSSGFMLGLGIPVQVIMIPLFFLMFRLQLVNSLPGLILAYAVVQLPFTVFLLTGFFVTLPSEMEESAAIDGASRWQAFIQIMIPLAMPGIVTAAIFNFVFIINEFLLALVLLQDNDNYTLSLGLFALYGNMRYTGDWVALFAGFTIVMLPSLLAYLVLSRRIMEGLTLGATKG